MRRRLRVETEPRDERLEGEALHEDRHDHDEEHHVEDQLTVGVARRDREGGEHDRHRAPQARPSSPASARDGRSRTRRSRPGPRAAAPPAPARRRRRARRGPARRAGSGTPAGRAGGTGRSGPWTRGPGGSPARPGAARRPVGDHHPRHVDGEEPGRLGRRARRRRRGRPGPAASTGYSDAAASRARRSTSAPAHPTATPMSTPPTRFRSAEHHPVGGIGMALPCRQQADGEHHRHGVVGAGLDLEQVAEPPRHGDARSAVNTAAASVDDDDRADEQRGGARRRRAAAPATSATTPAVTNTPIVARTERGRGDPPHLRQPDAQAALVEDDDQRGDGERLGELRVRQADRGRARRRRWPCRCRGTAGGSAPAAGRPARRPSTPAIRRTAPPSSSSSDGSSKCTLSLARSPSLRCGCERHERSNDHRRPPLLTDGERCGGECDLVRAGVLDDAAADHLRAPRARGDGLRGAAHRPCLGAGDRAAPQRGERG